MPLVLGILGMRSEGSIYSTHAAELLQELFAEVCGGANVELREFDVVAGELPVDPAAWEAFDGFIVPVKKDARETALFDALTC